MEWLRRLPWKRLLAMALAVAVLLVVVADPARGKDKYVAVQGGSDAVLLAKPVRMGKALTRLVYGESVEVLEEPGRGYVKVRLERDGEWLEGWIKSAALVDEKPKIEGASASTAEGASAAGAAAKGLNSEIEGEVKENDPNFARMLETVDRMEQVRRDRLEGGAPPPEGDPVKLLESCAEFGEQGGLIKTNP